MKPIHPMIAFWTFPPAIVLALIVTLGSTIIVPAASAQTPGAFGKISPANGATGVSANPTLSWGASSNATSYEYCVTVTGICSAWTSTGAALSVVKSGLGPSTTFYWQVRAINANGTTYADGSSAALWTFTTLAKPGSFSKSSPAAYATEQPTNLTLSWTASSNATSYEYCYDTTYDSACSGWTSVGTGLSVDLTGLTANTAYYWQVRANNAIGTTYADGSDTAFRVFTTVSPPGAFSKINPTNGVTGMSTSATLTWQAGARASSYEYCYDTSNDGACSGWTNTSTALSVGLTGLTANTTYYWQVRANNAIGTTYADGSGSAFWTFTTSSPPGAFTKISPANSATGQPTSLTLSWTGSSNAPSYEYCYDTTNDSACSGWTSAGTALSVGLSRLTPSTTYYWQVRAYKSGWTTYADGSDLAFWVFTTASPPGAFTKISPANGATGLPTNVTLSWLASSNATSYEYCVSALLNGVTGGCGAWTSAGTALSVVTGLSPGIPFAWQVRAQNAIGTTYAGNWWWTFITAALPGSEGQPPSVVTLPASSVASTSAILNATVNPNGNSTTAWFDYGLTTSYGSQITAFPGEISIDPVSGASLVSVSARITALNCNTTYHFRIGAANTSSANGSDMTFTTAPCTGLSGAVHSLAVDPTTGQSVYAGTSTGIYRTANGGATWTQIWSGGQDNYGNTWTNVLALAIRPDAPCTIAAGVNTGVNNTDTWNGIMIVNSTGILASSNNCGATWGSMDAAPAGRSANSLAFSSSSPPILYASIVVNDATCSPVSCSDLLRLSTAQIKSSSSIQHYGYSIGYAEVFNVVATDPVNPCTTYSSYSGTYNDSHSVYQNTSCDDLNWTKVGETLGGIVSAIAVLATNPTTLLAGTQDGVIYRKVDAVSPWQSVAVVSGSIASIVYKPGHPLVAYAAGSGGVVYRTIDGGGTWNPMATIGMGVSSLAIGATAPASLYAGGNSFVISIKAGSPSDALDFDGDGKTDMLVMRPSTGVWYSLPSNSPSTYTGIQWGLSSDTPVPGNYDGDGKTDIAVWRPDSGIWYIMPSGSPGTYTSMQWGEATDKPIPADYDGDGKTDIAVWRPSTGVWYILLSSAPASFSSMQWGTSTDIPVPADYDGDGKTDIAVWRPSTGIWYILPSASPSTYLTTQWGMNGDIPVPGDYDGDGKTDTTIWRPSSGIWYIMPSGSPGTYTGTQWGLASDTPVPGDYDGDGKTDIAVWRPESGVWFILPSKAPGTYTSTQWGVDTDLPISALTGILRSIP
jgi:hypothetical protein